MTTADTYLPSRRRTAPNTAAPDVNPAPQNTVDVAVPGEIGAEPAAANTPSHTATGRSKRATQLRQTLRSRDGFQLAVQTAELLHTPVAFQRPRL